MEHDSDVLPEHDPSALAMVRQIGGDALLDEMRVLFAKQSSDRLEAARAALSAGDADGARRAFHALKSSTAQLGANAASRLCADGEALARTGDLAALGPLLDELEPSVDRALDWLGNMTQQDNAA